MPAGRCEHPGVRLADVSRLAAQLEGVSERRRDGLLDWRYRGRLVARQLDDSHVVIRASFDFRDLLLRAFPETFSVPERFARHMMVVADSRTGTRTRSRTRSSAPGSSSPASEPLACDARRSSRREPRPRAARVRSRQGSASRGGNRVGRSSSRNRRRMPPDLHAPSHHGSDAIRRYDTPARSHTSRAARGRRPAEPTAHDVPRAGAEIPARPNPLGAGAILQRVPVQRSTRAWWW